jgi:hypothetical protein
MDCDAEFIEITPTAASVVPTAAQVASGIPAPPVKLLQIMSDDDWEAFTEECLTDEKNRGIYHSIRRYSGAGDLGLDVVAFSTPEAFAKPWDSFQCKRYDHALAPTDVYGEIGKIIYHSFRRTPPFNQTERVPRQHVFVSPFGVGITLGRLLNDPERFRTLVREKWESHCVPKIGSGIVAPLEGDLLEYFEAFDFSIFKDRTPLELIERHSETAFHAARFGGGLPPRTQSETPPVEPTSAESLYLRKLFDAYGDHMEQAVVDSSDLGSRPDLQEHYNRQRVLFYSAESLRNFARDRTPPRTFDALQDDIFHGVIDVCESAYADGLQRLRTTISRAAQIDVAGNGLVGVTKVADKQGICHQLANDDRLTWTKPHE